MEEIANKIFNELHPYVLKTFPTIQKDIIKKCKAHDSMDSNDPKKITLVAPILKQLRKIKDLSDTFKKLGV